MTSALFDLDHLALAVDALTLGCSWPVGVLITATAVDAGTPLPHVEIFPLDERAGHATRKHCPHFDRSWHTVLGVSSPASLVDLSRCDPKYTSDNGDGHLVHLVDIAGNRATRLSTLDRNGSPIRCSVDLIGGVLDTWCRLQLNFLIASQCV